MTLFLAARPNDTAYTLAPDSHPARGPVRSPGQRAWLRGASLAIAALCLCLSATAQETKDTVVLKDGKSETGSIKSEEYAGLAFSPTKGPPRTIEWSQIAPDGITYGGAGAAELQSAKDSLAAGKVDEALQKLELLKGEAKLRAVLKQNVLYYIPVLQQRKGDYDAAIAGFKELVAAYPKSRYLMDVGERMVACYAAQKDVAGGSKALDELSAAANAAGVENGFGSAINVLKGRILEQQGKFPEAAAAYGVAEKASGVSPTVVFQARLGQARCFVALNRKPDAEAIYRKLVSEDAPNAILAGAWNGLGDLLKEEARKGRDGKGDPEKVLDALYAYLRGVVQYAPVPGETTDEYERALAGSRDCFKFMSDLETKADLKKLYRDRSAERGELLKKEYPNSPYVKGP